MPSAFMSPNAGPLGWIAEDRIRIVIAARPTVTDDRMAREPPAVAADPDDFSFDPALLSSLLHDPPAGLVIAAFGVGHVPLRTLEPIKALAPK